MLEYASTCTSCRNPLSDVKFGLLHSESRTEVLEGYEKQFHENKSPVPKFKNLNFFYTVYTNPIRTSRRMARGSVGVKGLCYKPEGSGFETR
jgi:hypothetical protein